jgi:short-subunit dehydrogenase
MSVPDRNKRAELAKALGVRALAIEADSTDPDAVTAAVGERRRSLAARILVINAGIAAIALLTLHLETIAPLRSTCGVWPRRRRSGT